MKQLSLLRHAKSDQDGTPDFERTLNLRGLSESVLMGKHLRDIGHGVDLILCSSSMRTRQTCERVCLEWGYSGDIEYRDDLYLATRDHLLTTASHSSVSRLMLIAHNPGIEELASQLANKILAMPPCALAIFNGEPWRLASCQEASSL